VSNAIKLDFMKGTVKQDLLAQGLNFFTSKKTQAKQPKNGGLEVKNKNEKTSRTKVFTLARFDR